MTLEQAIADQAAWVPTWVIFLTIISIVIPVALLFWRASRLAGVLTVVAMVIAGIGVQMLFDRYGYIGLIALPHVVLWTPLVVFLVTRAQREEMPRAPRLLIYVLSATLVVSLAFDYISVLGYFAGAA